MKNFYTLLFFLFAIVSILAQTLEKMRDQLVLRDASNTLLTKQKVGVELSILQTNFLKLRYLLKTKTQTTIN
jgi:hypothetical protein